MSTSSINSQSHSAQMRPLSLGDWIITLLIFSIPLIGQAAALFWGLSSTTNIHRKNASLAYLIVLVCLIIASVLIVLISEQLAWLIFGYVPSLSELLSIYCF